MVNVSSAGSILEQSSLSPSRQPVGKSAPGRYRIGYDCAWCPNEFVEQGIA